MSKPKYLKTSFWKRMVKKWIINIFLIDFKLWKKETDENKILIITLDALGDNVIKNKTIKILEENFGYENTYILCKSKWKSIYELQNYKYIFTDESSNNIFYKIKLYRKLNNIGFGTIAILNHSYLAEEVNYVVNGKKYNMSEPVNYILEKHIILLKKILQKEFRIQDIMPNLRVYFPERKYNNIISIAVGTADYPKTPTYNNLKKYIDGILKLNINKTIYLLGTGIKQQKVATKLVKELKSQYIINAVDNISLLEVMQIIKDSDLFIGGDSGLYNIAFSLGTKTICLHWIENYPLWEHKTENVKILKGKGGKEYIDSKYGTEILNSITFSQIEQAMKELNVN